MGADTLHLPKPLSERGLLHPAAALSPTAAPVPLRGLSSGRSVNPDEAAIDSQRAFIIAPQYGRWRVPA